MSSKAERITRAAAGVAVGTVAVGIAAGTVAAAPVGIVVGAATAAVVDCAIQKLEKRGQKKK